MSDPHHQQQHEEQVPPPMRPSPLAYDDPRPGEVREITPSDQYRAMALFDEQIAYAEKSHTHLWIVNASFTLPLADLLAAEEPDAPPVALHPQYLRMVATGCYICEEPFTPRLARRRCPGDPSGHPNTRPTQ